MITKIVKKHFIRQIMNVDKNFIPKVYYDFTIKTTMLRLTTNHQTQTK